MEQVCKENQRQAARTPNVVFVVASRAHVSNKMSIIWPACTVNVWFWPNGWNIRLMKGLFPKRLELTGLSTFLWTFFTCNRKVFLTVIQAQWTVTRMQKTVRGWTCSINSVIYVCSQLKFVGLHPLLNYGQKNANTRYVWIFPNVWDAITVSFYSTNYPVSDS